jgi:hypothetical protein
MNRLLSCLLRIQSRIDKEQGTRFQSQREREAGARRGSEAGTVRKRVRVLDLRLLLSPIKGRGALPADRPVRVGDLGH